MFSVSHYVYFDRDSSNGPGQIECNSHEASDPTRTQAMLYVLMIHDLMLQSVENRVTEVDQIILIDTLSLPV